MARATPGFSGADLANLINEAAIVAVRHDRDVISAHDIDEARDRIILGRRDGSERPAARGEALPWPSTSRATPWWRCSPSTPTRWPRSRSCPPGRALGVTEQLPVDERHLYPESYLHDSLAVRLGGRAAEVLVLGEASTGASNDLAGATDLAVRMVREWGLSAATRAHRLRHRRPAATSGESAGSVGRPYAEATQRAIDEEVSRLLLEAEERARTLLTENRAALDGSLEVLLEKETISGPGAHRRRPSLARRYPGARTPARLIGIRHRSYTRAVPSSQADLVVGFDLDMTLIDPRRSVRSALERSERGTRWSPSTSSSSCRRSDHPSRRRWPRGSKVTLSSEACWRYRELCTAPSSPRDTDPMPGAVEAVRAVRDRRAAKCVVITAKYEPHAHISLEAVGIEADAVVGWKYGPAKGDVLRDHGAQLYVGDHPADVLAAQAGGTLCVAVASGGTHVDRSLRSTPAPRSCSRVSLAFPPWLEGWLA